MALTRPREEQGRGANAVECSNVPGFFVGRDELAGSVKCSLVLSSRDGLVKVVAEMPDFRVKDRAGLEAAWRRLDRRYPNGGRIPPPVFLRFTYDVVGGSKSTRPVRSLAMRAFHSCIAGVVSRQITAREMLRRLPPAVIRLMFADSSVYYARGTDWEAEGDPYYRFNTRKLVGCLRERRDMATVMRLRMYTGLGDSGPDPHGLRPPVRVDKSQDCVELIEDPPKRRRRF